MNGIFLIAKNSLKEALRQKLIFMVLIVAVALTLFSTWASTLDLGGGHLQFVGNFTAGALGFFGAVIAIVSTCQLFYAEIENKTVWMLLARPVGRLGFIGGKLLGEIFMIYIFVSVVMLAGAVSMALAQARLDAIPEEFFMGGRPHVDWLGFAAFGFLQGTKLAAIAAMAMFVCAASRSMMFAVVASFMVCAASAISYSEFFSGGSFWLDCAILLIPNFSIFEPSLNFAFEGANCAQFFAALGYGAVYILAFLMLGVWAFRSREI